MRKNSIILILAALLVMAVALPAAAQDTCGAFGKFKVQCQDDHSVMVYWEAAINGNCSDVVFSIERQDGSSWVTIYEPASSPYYDPSPRPYSPGAYYTYRIKMSCTCGGEYREIYTTAKTVQCPNS